jgi:hypothetical protein
MNAIVGPKTGLPESVNPATPYDTDAVDVG